MKTCNIIKGLGALVLTGGLMCSCSDMLDTPTSTHRYDNGNDLSHAADSLYSAMGILSGLQQLGERYVLFGELRGDMVTVTPDADFSLREIADFDVTADNKYLSQRDWYAVINNCNYALARMDTSITIHTDHVMMREYTAIKAMRAWTYLQMGLAFGSARYIDRPILSLEESEAEYPELTLDALVPKLIADLETIAGENTPDYGDIDGLRSTTFFVQPRLLLADLYLYSNNYERAAQLYYDYIERNRIAVDYNYGNYWTSSSQDKAVTGNVYAYTTEALTIIPYSSNAGEIHPDLYNMTFNRKPSILPAAWWTAEMNSIEYYQADNLGINTISGYLQGDLRGQMVFRGGELVSASAFGPVTTDANSRQTLITKFYQNATDATDITSLGNPGMPPCIVRSVVTCRIPHVYLRLAEAANRAGKPSFAFAILKNGLNREVMTDEVTINPAELADGAAWTNFAVLDLPNYGTAMRGRGLGIRLDGSGYKIPELETRADSVEWVENEILREMAAETAFEGNRFFDLLRVSRHRADHPALMAERISARADNPAAMQSRLLSSDNWWVK